MLHQQRESPLELARQLAKELSAVLPLLKEPNAEPIPGYRLVEPLGSGGFGEGGSARPPAG